MRIRFFAVFALASVILLMAGCIGEPETPPVQPPSPQPSSPPAQNVTPAPPVLPNPAASYCGEMNYTYILKNESSGQTGYCILGIRGCDEWELFRQECCLQDADCADMNCTDGTAYCSSQACHCPKILEPVNDTGAGEPTPFPVRPTNSTVGGILDDGLDQIDREAYKQLSAGQEYTSANPYKWQFTGNGNLVPLLEVLFNDEIIPSIRGLAFKVFEPANTDTPQRTLGLGVFLGTVPLMEDSMMNGTPVRIDFHPAQHKKLLEKCEVFNRQVWQNATVPEIAVYFFDCPIAWDG